MRTDIAVDKLCNVSPFISDFIEKISKDKETKEKLKSFVNSKENKEKSISSLFKVIPLILQKGKDEIYNILSIFFEKSVDEIKEQEFSATAKQIYDLVNDKDFMSFFTLFFGQDKKV